MASRLKSLLWSWLPVVFWVSIIAFESTNLLSSANTGSILYKVLKAIFGPIRQHDFDLIHFVLRKLGHFVGYGILGLLFFRAVRRTYMDRTPSSESPAQQTLRELLRRAANVAVLCTAGVASLDEWHQTFLPSRTGALHDVVLDTMGAIVLLLFVLAHYSRTLRTTEAE
jgi:VanZ family protein